MLEFNSLNPLQTLAIVTADSAEELVVMIRAIKTPITVVSIHSNATMTKWKAFISGDVRIQSVSKTKKK